MDDDEGLDRREQTEVRQRRSPRALVVFETIRREGVDELARAPAALGWSGLAAGLSMGFSFLAEALLGAHLPAAQWTPLITKLGYSVGFIIVILARQQLFTENTLTPVLQLLHRHSAPVFLRTLRLWAVVLSANLLGTALFAWVLAATPVFGPELKTEFERLSVHGYGDGFWVDLLRAVFAGWLIALMVWLLPFAETGRVLVIVVLSYLIGLGGFPHVIAGSVEALYAVFAGTRALSDYLLGFFLPALAGNVLGGVALVSALHHAQVMADHHRID